MVRLGEHVRHTSSESALTLELGVARMVNHPGYDRSSYDLALVSAATSCLAKTQTSLDGLPLRGYCRGRRSIPSE